MRKSFKISLLIILFISAFLLRAILSSKINQGDILVINEWSRNIYEKGLEGSYFREGWIYSSPTQPPLMMMAYWVSRWLYENKYVLSALHNVIRMPPTFVLLWVHENGPFFSVKLWGILADLFAAFIAYKLINKILRKPKIAVWAAILVLFNPVAIFESTIWGQTDMFASLFALLSFLVFNKRLGKLFSPLLFTVGISLKPTILVLFPFYLVFVLREIILSSPKERKIASIMFIFGLLLSIGLTILSFVPFWDQSKPFFEFLRTVVTRRIIPSAKGIIRVATSAFNFYTIFFNVEKTTVGFKIGIISLGQLGTFMFILINLLGLGFLFRKKEKNTEFPMLLFSSYFVSEGTFLFNIGMAERYFFPAFLFIYLLLFLIKDIKIKILICFQFVLWFLNLYLTFFMRDISIIDKFLRENNHLGTRVLSLMNVLVFVYISLVLLRRMKNVRLLSF